MIAPICTLVYFLSISHAQPRTAPVPEPEAIPNFIKPVPAPDISKQDSLEQIEAKKAARKEEWRQHAERKFKCVACERRWPKRRDRDRERCVFFNKQNVKNIVSTPVFDSHRSLCILSHLLCARSQGGGRTRTALHAAAAALAGRHRGRRGAAARTNATRVARQGTAYRMRQR